MIGVEICVLRVAGSAGKGIFVIYRFLFTFLHYNVKVWKHYNGLS